MKLTKLLRNRLEERRWPAVLVEHADALTLADPAARHIDVDLFFTVRVRCAPDQERLNVHRQRPIASVPPAVLEEQVLACLKSEDRQRREAVAFRIEPEKDRIFVLNPPEFIRDDAVMS